MRTDCCGEAEKRNADLFRQYRERILRNPKKGIPMLIRNDFNYDLAIRLR